MKANRVFFSLMSIGILTCLMSGCATKTEGLLTNNGVTTYDGLSASYPADVQGMAQDAALALAEQLPPGRTSLALQAASGIFGESLETALRNQGFTLDQSGLPVGYVIDQVNDEQTGYVQMQLGTGERFGFVRPLGLIQPYAAEMSYDPIFTEPLLPPPSQSSQSDTASALLTQPSAWPKPVPISMSAPALAPVILTSEMPTGSQNKPLRLAILNQLPHNWKYTILDESKREIRVSWPVKADWRDKISFAATQAGCEVRFDESARRVTVVSASPKALPIESEARPVALPTTFAVPETSAAPVVSTASLTLPAPAQKALAELSTLATPDLAESSPLITEEDVPVMAVFQAPEADSDGWALNPGSLEGQLKNWGNRAGWQVLWKADHDIELQAHAIMRGSFEEAVAKVFQGVNLQGNALRVTLYTANNVLEVQED